jgi:hypothetical protein
LQIADAGFDRGVGRPRRYRPSVAWRNLQHSTAVVGPDFDPPCAPSHRQARADSLTGLVGRIREKALHIGMGGGPAKFLDGLLK